MMFQVYEYETDPVFQTAPTTAADDELNVRTTSSSSSSSSSHHHPPPPPLMKPQQIYQIRWCATNISSTNSTKKDDSNAVDDDDDTSMKLISECVPKLESLRYPKTSSSLLSFSNDTHHNNPIYHILQNCYTRILYVFSRIRHIFYELILPVQYPHSVRDGYLSYQFYDSIQGFCSYLRNIVCSAALFQAVVVMNHPTSNNIEGDDNDIISSIGSDGSSSNSSHSNNSVSHTAWNAAIVWAIRDGTGLIGSLLYTYLISPYLDAYVKEFRFFADIINDIGFTFDMILPYTDTQSSTSNSAGGNNNTHSTLFWIVSSSSVLCKMMCGVSAGATKSSITCHFALQGNMADLNAKESTQETMVTLLGMIGGIYMAQLLQSLESHHKTYSRWITWIFFVVLTTIHIYANYLGVSLLRLRTINTSRIDPCLQDMYKHVLPIVSERVDADTSDSTTTGKNRNNEPLLTEQPYANIRTLLLTAIASPTQINEIMFLPVWRWIGLLPSSGIYCNTIPYRQLQPYFHQSLLGQLLLSSSNKTKNNFIPTGSSGSIDFLDKTTTHVLSLRYNVTIMMNTDTLIMTTNGRKTMKPKVAITLLTGATSHDELQAYIHAKMIVILLQQQHPLPSNGDAASVLRQILLDSYYIVQSLFQTPPVPQQYQTENETNLLDTPQVPILQQSPPTLPLIIDVLQEKDWDVSRFYFNYPPTRCQLVLDTTKTTTTTPEDYRTVVVHAVSGTDKKDN